MSTTLFLPVVIIILTAIIQKLIFNIPLIDKKMRYKEDKELKDSIV